MKVKKITQSIMTVGINNNIIKNIQMEEIKKVLNSWWFKSAAYGAGGTALLIYGYPLYAGIAYGIGATEFFKYFKK